VRASFLRLLRTNPFEALVTALGALYFGLALSPSSYAYALRNYFGVTDTGTYLGVPRLERWDEWAVQTPFVQAVVRNDFGTHNATSFYGESFRNLIALPVMDWGFIFRPLHWGYLVLPAPWAFSLTWALSAWLTLVGFSVLLRRCGLGSLPAVAATLAIFLAPFTQAWWTGIAPLLAFFPWILIVSASRMRLRYAAPLVAWLTGCWVVSSAYLPGLLLLGFVAVVLLLAFFVRRADLGRLAVLGGAAVVGAAAGGLYLLPVLQALAGTVYPGHRVIPGGTLPIPQWLAQFTPFGVTKGYTSTISSSLPESVAIGSWLPLLALALVDYRRLRRDLSRAVVRPFATLIGGFVLLTAWQVLDLAHVVGTVFLWNRSSEQRSLMASGLLLIIAAGWVLSRFPLRVTPARVAGFFGLMVAATAVAARVNTNHTLGSRDLARDNVIAIVVALVLVAVVVVVARDRARPRQIAGAVALAAVLPAAAMWALYNPVQDSRAIFAPIHDDVTRYLDETAAQRPDGAIGVNFPGAILNGQGYRSVVHVLPTPQVDTFAAMFPDLDKAQLNEIFNRYAELFIIPGQQPKLEGNGIVGLPAGVIGQLATIPDH
jgi:hypothetical protein